MGCGVYRFRHASGKPGFVRLTHGHAATRPMYELVRQCGCEEEISIDDGRQLVPGGRRHTVWGGLGDVVADSIHFATLGLVEPCNGCRERQELLNTWFRFSLRSKA